MPQEVFFGFHIRESGLSRGQILGRDRPGAPQAGNLVAHGVQPAKCVQHGPMLARVQQPTIILLTMQFD
jgi:hypothetical protein